MSDDKKKKVVVPSEPGYVQKLLEKYSPFHIVGKKLEDAVGGKKKPETEEQRKQRLIQQAMVGANAKKK